MQLLYTGIFLALAVLFERTQGVSVVVKDNHVYVDGKAVDLSKEQVIKDTALYTTYELRAGESVITITKSKMGNSITVQSKGPMTEAERKKMEEMQTKIEEDVNKNIHQVQDEINTFSKQLNERITNMNKQFDNMFKHSFFSFF